MAKAAVGRIAGALAAQMKPGSTTGVFLFLACGVFTLAVAKPVIAASPMEFGAGKPLDPEQYAQVVAKVLPKEGYTLPIKWGDLGVKLVLLGVIDLGKFKKLYEKGLPAPELRYLEEPSEAFITINEGNQHFLVTVFWGLGLANKNPVLERLAAARPERELMGLASTAGWTLGKKPASELYSNFDILPLTPEQQELVSELAQSIYRPCCDNPTAFPDCNHGIALLGLIELMAANGFSREEILKASLKFNAFWFPQHYVKTALLFQLQGIDWDAVDLREVLGPRYSSLSGWRQYVDGELKKLAQLLPPEATGASCGVSALPAAAAGEAQPSTSPGVHHIHGLALDRTDPEVLYIATHTGLVRLRPNSAPEWVGSHRFDLMGFTTHPKEANVVYASGHPDPATYQQQEIANFGLLSSQDGGKTWQTVALKGEADFHALTYSPRGGHLYGWSVAGQRGLYRISATTWTVEHLPAQGLSSVFSLSASPDPAGMLLAGTRAGLMKSEDGGVSWVHVTAIPTDAAVTTVSYHALDARVVYAYIARSDLGLMRSRDGGATWEPTGFVLDARAPVVALTVGPGDHVVVATTRADVLRSWDGARTWQRVLEQGRLVAGLKRSS